MRSPAEQRISSATPRVETATDKIRRAAIRNAARTRTDARLVLDEAGRLVGLPFKLLGRPASRLVERQGAAIGHPAGTLIAAPEARAATAEVHFYTREWAESKSLAQIGEPEALALRRLASGEGTTWINVDGVTDTAAVAALGGAFALHPLVQEDLTHTTQRPKLEIYGEQVFVVTRMVHPITGAVEQVAFILGPGYLLSFQEVSGDVFDPVRQRIETAGSRLRGEGPDYLLYALLDVIVDAAWATVERLGDATEALEEAVLGEPGLSVRAAIAGLRREVLVVRRAVWPLREVVASLARSEDALVTDKTRLFLRDVQDHIVQAADALETLREVIAGLSDLYLTAVSMRQNEVMKALTVIGAVFLPITFLTGLYGMNFDQMPELHLPYAYPTFLIVLAVIGFGTLGYFRARRWL